MKHLSLIFVIASYLFMTPAAFAEADTPESAEAPTEQAQTPEETPEETPETTEAPAEEAASEPEGAVMATPEDLTSIRYSCANQQLTRRLEVDYLNAPQQVPCEVNYYKDTEMPDTKQTLWQAQNTEGYCEDMAQGFIAKLSNWGWNCEKQ